MKTLLTSRVYLTIIGQNLLLGVALSRLHCRWPFYYSCQTPACPKSDISGKQPVVDTIINLMKTEEKGKTFDELSYFLQKFGPRYLGSGSLEDAIDYIIYKLRSYGLTRVWTEKVLIPTWRRGTEFLTVVSPVITNLTMVGALLSSGTQRWGILSKPIVWVTSLRDLRAKRQEIRGKMVLFSYLDSADMDYFKLTLDMEKAVVEAMRYGSVGFLSKSLAPSESRMAHTGAVPKEVVRRNFPVVQLSIPSANYLAQLAKRSEVIINLYMEAILGPPSFSRNIITEIRGHSSREEVIIAGHLDSVDIAEGAQDDGAGAFVTLRALAVLKRLGLRPKRTIRGIFFTGEEITVRGSTSYVRRHRSKLGRISIMLNCDEGVMGVEGLVFSGLSQCAKETVQEVLRCMKPLNATRLLEINEDRAICRTDAVSFMKHGVPSGLMRNKDLRKYFNIHHSYNDTRKYITPEELDTGTAFWASLAYIFADIEEKIPSGSAQCPMDTEEHY